MWRSMSSKRAAHVKTSSGNYFPSGVPKLDMNLNSELQLSPGNHQLEDASGGDRIRTAPSNTQVQDLSKQGTVVSDDHMNPHIAGDISSMKECEKSRGIKTSGKEVDDNLAPGSPQSNPPGEIFTLCSKKVPSDEQPVAVKTKGEEKDNGSNEKSNLSSGPSPLHVREVAPPSNHHNHLAWLGRYGAVSPLRCCDLSTMRRCTCVH